MMSCRVKSFGIDYVINDMSRVIQSVSITFPINNGCQDKLRDRNHYRGNFATCVYLHYVR